jgi:hypothetical protein
MNITAEKLDKAMNWLECETASPHQQRWAELLLTKYLSTATYTPAVYPQETREWLVLNFYNASRTMKAMSDEDYREACSDELSID